MIQVDPNPSPIEEVVWEQVRAGLAGRGDEMVVQASSVATPPSMLLRLLAAKLHRMFLHVRAVLAAGIIGGANAGAVTRLELQRMYAVSLQKTRAFTDREQAIQTLLVNIFHSRTPPQHPGLHKLFLPMVVLFAPASFMTAANMTRAKFDAEEHAHFEVRFRTSSSAWHART